MLRQSVIAAAVLVSLVYVACGGDNNNANSANNATTSSASATSTTTSTTTTSTTSAAPTTSASPTPPPAKPLIDQVGGKDALAKIVSGTIAVLTDTKDKDNKAANAKLSKGFVAILKDKKLEPALEKKFNDILNQASGGDAKFDMTNDKADKPLRFAAADFDIIVAAFGKSLTTNTVAKDVGDALTGKLTDNKDLFTIAAPAASASASTKPATKASK
jgi:hypothetical protein